MAPSTTEVLEGVLVLLVEDNPGDARLIREMLKGETSNGHPFAVTHAETLRAAELQLASHQFDVVLLDLHLPDSTGLETLKAVGEVSAQIPVIVLSGLNDDLLTAQAVTQGAQDYIPKDECHPRLLTRLIHYAIERKQVEEKLRYMAMHDALTGLPNRTLLYDRLARARQRAQRKAREINTRWKFAVMMVDLDNFKMINDRFGHAAGDQALQQVARRLESCLRQSDSISRWGGDEFVIVLEGVRDRKDCEAVSRKILRALNTPSMRVGENDPLSVSIGVSLFPDDGEDFDALLRFADRAMYSGKGRKDSVIFHEGQA